MTEQLTHRYGEYGVWTFTDKFCPWIHSEERNKSEPTMKRGPCFWSLRIPQPDSWAWPVTVVLQQRFIWIQLRKLLKCFPVSPCYSHPAFPFRPLLPDSSCSVERGREIKSSSEITACCSPWQNLSHPPTVNPRVTQLQGQSPEPLSSAQSSLHENRQIPVTVLDPENGAWLTECWYLTQSMETARGHVGEGSLCVAFWLGCCSLAVGQSPCVGHAAAWGPLFLLVPIPPHWLTLPGTQVHCLASGLGSGTSSFMSPLREKAKKAKGKEHLPFNWRL